MFQQVLFNGTFVNHFHYISLLGMGLQKFSYEVYYLF